jgi:hypothetical protein
MGTNLPTREGKTEQAGKTANTAEAPAKVGRYLKYAIGEIILVVIGILIALSINNWNEERKIKKEEHSALLNLKEDFEYNLSSIDDLIEATNSGIEVGLEVLGKTGKRYQEAKNFNLDSMLSQIGTHDIYLYQSGFLNDLINSGKIGIIRNDSLRVSLSSWGQNIEELYRKEQTALHHQTALIDYIKKNGSWLNVDNLYPLWGLAYPKSGFEMDNKKLMENIEFENIIDEIVNRKGGLRLRQKKVQELNMEILRIIERELEHK